MGMMVAVDATAKGEIKKEQVKWATYGWQGGFSSPVLDGERLYQVDNSANIAAFDVKYRQATVAAKSRHNSKSFSGAGRWQALCRD